MSHCLTTGTMAERLGLGADVSAPLQQVFTRWDGKGVPGTSRRRGHRLTDAPVPSRRHGRGLPPHPRHRRRRRGRASTARARTSTRRLWTSSVHRATEVLGDIGAAADWPRAHRVRTVGLQRRLTESRARRARSRRSPTSPTCGRRRGRGTRGRRRPCCHAARRTVGLPDARCRDRCAEPGSSTTSGCTGCPRRSSTSPGPLSRRGVGADPYAAPTTRSGCSAAPRPRPDRCNRLAHARALRRLRLPPWPHRSRDPGRWAAARRRVRVQAMTEPRPYRPAMTPTEAKSELRAQVRAGRLDADAVDAVLAAAGQRHGKRRSGPAGLTPREIEVLTLIARGASDAAGRAATRRSLPRPRKPTSSGSTRRPGRRLARPRRSSRCSTACSTRSTPLDL